MRKFIFFFFFSGIVIASRSQTSSWPNTLLWKISGNNLSQPSFLFGTMHLQDKRLFYFGDSLYHYLEKAEGYALEVDLQELLDSFIQKAVEQGAMEALDDKKMKPADEKKMIDSLLRNVKQLKDKSSKKELERIRQRKIKKILSKDQMPTIVDAYLFNVAKRQGKWVGGIEDVQDQLTVYDELGADIDSSELMSSESKLKSSLEEMINIYVKADLGKIEKYSLNEYSPGMTDLIFTKRNLKMSRRMDSLMNIRTMFFAVGAAHLPGDSGVINLLKRKGYNVEPVFSTQKIDPEKYSAKLAKLPWVRITDEKNTYTIEMPGQPSDMDIFGELFKMKLYFDITTLTFYMSGSTLSQNTVNTDDMMEAFSKKIKEGKLENQRHFEKDGAKGMEADISTEAFNYKIQFLVKNNIVYMLMAGSENKSTINSSDLAHYFDSFAATDQKQAGQGPQKEWKVFSLEDKGFSIMLPGSPKRNKVFEKNAEGTNWSFSVFDYNDMTAGVYYMVQVRDLVPGYYLTGDSVYFSLFKANVKETVKHVTKDEMIKVQGFPAFRYEGNMGDNRTFFATVNINRGNRVYTLMAVTANGSDDPLVKHFFESFSITDYKKSDWKKEVSPDGNFYTKAPGEITIKKSEAKDKDNENIDETENGKTHYISFNANEVISYEVFKEALPKYYWAENDSSFFAHYAGVYKSYEDSVLSKRMVTNGNLKASEWVISMPGNNNLKKVRLVVNYDTLYTLVSFIPSQYIDRKDHQLFFDGFRVTNENSGNFAFTSKAEKIFSDLESGDSATFSNASDAITSAPFTKKDLPLLHEKLIRTYWDDTSYYYNTRSKIKNAVIEIADNTTVDFIRNHFDDPDVEKALLKFDLLDVLARCKTDYSYTVLKDLLLNHTPKERRDDQALSYRITDSIGLTKKLFPEILSLSNNKVFAERIMSVSREMLDSNAISLQALKPFESNFLHTADTALISLKKRTDKDYGYVYIDMINLLSRFNDDKSNAMLQQYMLLDDLNIKQEAVIDLLKNNRSVDPKQVEKLAADKVFRKDIYDALAEIKKENLFPAKYKTQRYMAESEIYYYASDEDEPSEIIFVAEKTAEYNGKKQRFFLFKVVYEYEEESSQYLGIVGPYSLDAKNTKTESDASGLYWDENFDAKKVDASFKKYMAKLTEGDEK